MSLNEQINSDLKSAMKAREEIRVQTLRMLRTEILKLQKDGRTGDVEDQEILGKVQTLIKQRRESADQFRKGSREEMAQAEEAEIEVLKAYLPAEATESEIREAISAVIASVGASGPAHLGKVMGPVLGKLRAAGKSVDGKLVNALVREALAE